MAQTLPLVSAIVVTHDRADFVMECIASLLAQSEARLEIVVVLNGATPEVAARVAKASAGDARVRSLAIDATSPSQARNLGVEQAHAPLFYFLDDDVLVPKDGIERLLAFFGGRPSTVIAGGPNLTPPDDPAFAQITGELLASWLGTGIARCRFATGPSRAASERHLMLCNLAVRRSLFEQGHRFPTLFGGEENVLMGHAGHGGHELWYSPELWVHHRRRRDLLGYLAQIHRYGWGRAFALRSAPGTFHLAYFVPVVLFVYVVALPGLVFVTPLALLPLVAYAALCSGVALGIGVRRKRILDALVLAPLFPLTHLAYAVGLVSALFRPKKFDPAPAVSLRPG
jgi:succinoglycan biosynthesis protein ExoA